MEIIDEHHVARRVLMAEASGRSVRSRPRIGWIVGVKMTFGNRWWGPRDSERRIGRRRALVHM